MAWIILFIAGLFETAWAVGLKQSQGFTRLWPGLVVVICMPISVVLLAKAMKTLPLGTAYAVWTGIGAVGAVLIGIAFMNEPRTLARLLCIAMIIGGILGLRFLQTPH